MKLLIDFFKGFTINKIYHHLIVFLGIFYIVLFNLFLNLLENTEVRVLITDNLATFLIMYILSFLAVSLYLVQDLRKKDFYRLLIIFLIYTFLRYVILITRNLNNPSFNFKFDKFMMSNDITPFLIIFLLLFFWNGLLRIERLNNIIRIQYHNKLRVIHYFSGLLVITNKDVVAILRDNISSLITSENYILLLKYIIPVAFYLMVCMVLFSIVLENVLQGIKSNKSNFSMAILMSSVLAVIFNYYLQKGVASEGELLGRYIFPGATLYQIIFLTLLSLLAYLIINRFVLTTVLITVIFTILVTANKLKFELRNEPVLLSDVTWLTNPTQLIEFSNNNAIYLYLALGLLIVILANYLGKYIFPNQLIKQWKHRAIYLISLLFIFYIPVMVFKTENKGKVISGIPVLSRLNNWYDIEWFGFSVNARYKSLVFVWTKQLTKNIMDQPTGYSKEAIEKLRIKYRSRADEINKSRTENIADQTVIFILSESLSNPNRLDGITINKNVLENIDKIKSTTTSGLMTSDGYGGGTANMEFQSLTGLPLKNFSSSVSVLMTEVAPKMSTVFSISDHFQSNSKIFIHPSGSNNYNRNNMYDKLGFNKQLFLFDSKEKLKNIEYLGVSVSDKTTYQNILDNLDITKNQFFSVVTMQNHSPWSMENPIDIQAKGEKFTPSENSNLNSYAKLLSHTDIATKDLLDKLSEIDKKITVVFYGDHLPGFYPQSIFKKDSNSQYQTDYFIWSNKDNQKKEYGLIKSSDFPALLLSHTKSKVTPYEALLTDVLELSKIGDENLTDEQRLIREELKIVQYDITLGKGYLNNLSDFFE